MEIINRLKKTALSIGVVGFILAIFLSFVNLVLGIQWKVNFEDNLFSPRGFNPIWELAIKFLLIAILFFVFIAFIWMRNKTFLKVAALIPLALTFLQSGILIIRKPEGAPTWIMEYSTWAYIVLAIGYYYLLLTVSLVILQLYLLWSIIRLSFQKNS